MSLAKIWEFKTDRFRIVLTAEEESNIDLSWDDTGEVAKRIDSGDYVVFCAKCAVYLDGSEIAADYLGQCIYRSFKEFETSHRDTDPMNRNCSIVRAKHGNVVACHYFPSMVSTAIGEARKHIREMKPVYLREGSKA